jgi:hypothetical protein
MGDISIKGRSPLLKGGRVGFRTGGGSAPFLRGRSGSSNIKAPRGEAGWRQMQQAEAKIGRAVRKRDTTPLTKSPVTHRKIDPTRVGRLTVGKKSHIDTSAKQKLAGQRKREEIKNKEAREQWKEVDKLKKLVKTGAKIAGGGIGTAIVVGEVKQKLKKSKKDKKKEE